MRKIYLVRLPHDEHSRRGRWSGACEAPINTSPTADLSAHSAPADSSNSIISSASNQETVVSLTAPSLQERWGHRAYSARLLHIWRNRWVYILLLPGLLYFLAFYYLPLLGNIVAFQDYSPYLGFLRSHWVGLAN